MAKKSDPAHNDIRVFDMRVTWKNAPQTSWRVLAVSADARLAEFYRTVQGAFGWREWILPAQFAIGEAFYAGSKGTRTPLRRVVTDGMVGELTFDDTHERYHLVVEVIRNYVVRSRRHYPKVLEAEGWDASGYSVDPRFATWDAQEMARAIVKRSPAPDPQTEPSLEAPRFEGERESGFLACLMVGPMVMPSEWLPRIVGDKPLASEADARKTIGGVMSRYNAVADEFALGRIANRQFTAEWCDGFLWSMAVRGDRWREAYTADAELYRALEPILSGARGFVDSNSIARSLPVIREYWMKQMPVSGAPQMPIRRTQPKVSPNEPCPCGSGQKYKRCCSPLRVV